MLGNKSRRLAGSNDFKSLALQLKAGTLRSLLIITALIAWSGNEAGDVYWVWLTS